MFRILPKFYSLIVGNLRRKVLLVSVVWSAKRVIKNWFTCYFVSTSLIIELVRATPWGRRKLKSVHCLVCLRSGLKIVVTGNNFADVFSLVENYENYLKHLAVRFHPGDIIIDIGAHIGTFTVPLLFNNPGVRAIAFEPDPDNYELICKNAELNLGSTVEERLSLMQRAVFNRTGELRFSIGSSTTTGAVFEIGFYKTRAKAREIVCFAIAINEVFDKFLITNCKLMKIDCEGSEYEIFESLTDENLSKVENLILEAHPVRNREVQSLQIYLENKGFHVTPVWLANGCCEYFCCRREKAKAA